MTIDSIEDAWKEYASQLTRIDNEFSMAIAKADYAMRVAIQKRCDALGEVRQCHVNLLAQLQEEKVKL